MSWQKFYESLSEEDQLQNQAKYWIEKHRPDLLFYSIPNEGKRSQWEASRLKATGMVPGMPDAHVILHEGCDCYFEFKAPGKKPTKKQKEVHERLRSRGKTVYIVSDFVDFKTKIDQYFYNQNK